jgi:hypothetical protein
MTAVTHTVERSSNLECPMSDNDNLDNTHEDFRPPIVSKINSATQTPASVSSGQGNQQWRRMKEIKRRSWTCPGIIMIDKLTIIMINHNND